jgi:excisionase family DNA binding protein
MDAGAEVMTVEQAATYLQVSRGVIYRLIREGKLLASRIGRNYRIARWQLDTFLDVTRTRPDIPLREYTDDQLAQFLHDDVMTPEQAAIVQRFMGRAS